MTDRLTPQDRLQITITILTERAPGWKAWRKAVAEQTADGYPTGGDGGPRGSGISDPTFAAVGKRDQAADDMAGVEAAVIEMHGLAVYLDRMMSKYTPVPYDHDREVRLARMCVDCMDRLAVRRDRCWPDYERLLAAERQQREQVA